jgi:hypothetical protein
MKGKLLTPALLLFMFIDVSAVFAFEERLLGRKIEGPIESTDPEEKQEIKEELRRLRESSRKENAGSEKDKRADPEQRLPSQDKD